MTANENRLLLLVCAKVQALRDLAGRDPGACLTAGSPEDQALEMANELETSAAAVLHELLERDRLLNQDWQDTAKQYQPV